ncbi:transposon Tf2-6 polyprotein [Nephila pilipes]|uniref:Transposon Tf2-6 polyprotein n=1 Tax=Nephila pilipes TaxID=299642 RepID=A0A8X6PYL2_NEPPI|nr:transposon Tf2-6 polyprotein [Nephila pilipes]
MSEKRLAQFKKETELNSELQIVVNCIKEDWPKSYKSVDNCAKTYYKIKNNLYIQEGLLLSNEKANCKEPLKPHTVPYRPFEEIGVDKMDFGNISYLDIMDYSKWIEIAELANKCAETKLKTVFSSPHFSPSNEMVERAVGITKSMRKAKEDKRDYLVGLMEYRNTPISGLDLSSAQMMFNRRLKTKWAISNN